MNGIYEITKILVDAGKKHSISTDLEWYDVVTFASRPYKMKDDLIIYRRVISFGKIAVNRT